VTTTHGILPHLALSRATLDRAGHERRDPALIDRLLSDPGTRVAAVRGDRMRVEPTPGGARLALRPPEAGDADRLVVYLGRGPGGAAYAAVVEDDSPEPESEWATLRQVGAGLEDTDAGIFTAGLALANWHRHHPRCPRCGAATEPEQGGWIRRCEQDGSEHYPRTDPAVIMSVVDPAERLLLARSPGWPERNYSVLAGFVEPGESLESAVAREVAEEVGIVVQDARYLGNQPWPFPSSLMVGFETRAPTTELRLDPQEISDALWVTRDDYRARLRGGELRVPTGISIAKRIIEHWLGEPIERVVS
jgi:NAD+ diphosphatase